MDELKNIWLPECSEDYIKFLEPFGHTDKDYLRAHFSRFAGTFRKFSQGWNRDGDAVVLDVGAHWLHQSLLFAKNGFSVTAADFPATMDQPAVRSLSEEFNIELLPYSEIHSGDAFAQVPDNSVDILLFTEILEHITFNPIQFWQEVYRVLKPKSRIVLTTPNYYSADGRAWDLKRFLSGFGGGISNQDILQTLTLGHHWKEYSLKEVCAYFRYLSSDFHITRACLVDEKIQEIEGWRRYKKLLLPQIYCEIDLMQKLKGIEVAPTW